MPFDKDSFLKGVITGMRLPRTPGGKPPIPPVPSGRYILTESGEKVLTEIRPPEEDVPLYSTGVWYDTVLKRHDGTPNRRRFRWSGDKELKIFAFYYNYDDRVSQRRVLFLSETPLVGTTFYLDHEFEVFNPSTGWEIRTSTVVHVVPDADQHIAGIYYVFIEMFTYNTGSNYDWPDFQYKLFDDYLSHVLDYVAQFKASPMITEDNDNGQ